MIYKTFEEWKAGQWLEDGEPRTKAYTKDELLLIEMGWQYGFDAGKKIEITDEEIAEITMQCSDMDEYGNSQLKEYEFARAILRKASEKCNHSNFVKTEHLTGEGAMEYVEWFDNTCLDCGEHWTTNN